MSATGTEVGQEGALITPRAAAVAGILFSILLVTSQMLVWISIPARSGEAAMEVVNHSKTISLALNLLPFAGIVFCGSLPWVKHRSHCVDSARVSGMGFCGEYRHFS